jgi:undecaprenyl diphosphate synthase
MGEEAHTPEALADVPREAWPKRVAIVMDGNGRWARRQGLARVEGHKKGGEAARRVVEECSRLGIKQLTLFAFSSENWKRPPDEVADLMDLFRQNLRKERRNLVKNHIRFLTIGRREGIPKATLEEVDRTIRATASNTGAVLCMAVNYGSRGEITEAARRLAKRAAAGELDPDSITEATFAEALDTAGLADPDLVIRTAGEMRLSNFLLWQISYAELWVTETLWPDFKEADLHAAIRDYASRERRFGGLGPESQHA